MSNVVCGSDRKGFSGVRRRGLTCTRWETALTNADLGQAAMLDFVDKPLEEYRHSTTLDLPFNTPRCNRNSSSTTNTNGHAPGAPRHGCTCHGVTRRHSGLYEELVQHLRLVIPMEVCQPPLCHHLGHPLNGLDLVLHV